MNRIIAITGAHGFIGSYLRNYFIGQGFTVIGLVRAPAHDDERAFDLCSPQIHPALLKGIEVLIHCAFVRNDENKNAEVINLRAAENLKKAALVAGVTKIIFFSSLSAHSDARSSYGRSKLAIEKIFSEHDDVVLKCGLVIGDGGLFRQMLDFALKKKIVPLIDSGRQPVQFIAISDVATAVHRICSEHLTGTFLLAYPQAVTYRGFFKAIANHFHVDLKFIRLPLLLLRVALSFGGFIRLRLPVSKENLYGLQSMREWNSDESMKQLQLSSRSLPEVLSSNLPNHLPLHS
jgi:nucleoside-diphosphate-sugar epimerase